jgi:PAS domain S-box-containing protein
MSRRIMGSGQQPDPDKPSRAGGGRPGRNLAIALGLALVMAVAGYWVHFRAFLPETMRQTHAQLEKISEIKAQLLSNYYASLWRGAESVRTNKWVMDSLMAAMDGGIEAADEADLTAWLLGQMEIFRMAQIELFDVDGGRHLHLIADGLEDVLGLSNHGIHFFREALNSGTVQFSGLHLGGSGGRLHFSFVIPVGWEDSRGSASGVLVASFAPEDEFFELVQEEHNLWESFESVLAQEIDGEIAYLTGLRASGHSGQVLRLSSDADPASPAAQASQGRLGMVAGPDYSGREVIAYTRRILVKDCILICKVDRAEVLSPLVEKSRLYAFGAGSLTLALSMALLLLSRYHQVRALRRELALTLERNKALRAAAEIEMRFQNELRLVHGALDCSANVVVITDHAGRIVYANPAVRRLTGYTPDELLGKNPSVFRSGVHSPAFYQDLWETLQAGRVWEGEFTNQHKLGHHFHEQATITPVNDENGDITHFIAVKVDITERKQLEKQLYQALDKAVESSRLKSEFLATVSHELRTPMNGVVGMSELLLESDLGPDQMQMARVVKNCSENLMHLIEDLLDFSCIGTGQLRIQEERFNLRQAIEETVRLAQPRAATKQLDFHCEYDASLPSQVYGDRTRICQVLTNFLSNAVKFTAEGSVAVRAEPVMQGEARWMRLSVADTGIGVPAEFRPRIFDSFAQADGSHTRHYGGLGLGLAIAQRLVRLMDGHIGFESEPGRGSTFWLEIPVKEAPVPQDQRDGPDALALERTYGEGLRVLVADDDWSNLLVIKRLLESMGHRATTVSNGKEALERLSGGNIDLVFMDCRIPGLDGYQATRRIRDGAVPGIDPGIPIIAFTASVMEDNHEQCARAGMSGFLEKPVRKAQLAEVIRQVKGEGSR